MKRLGPAQRLRAEPVCVLSVWRATATATAKDAPKCGLFVGGHIHPAPVRDSRAARSGMPNAGSTSSFPPRSPLACPSACSASEAPGQTRRMACQSRAGNREVVICNYTTLHALNACARMKLFQRSQPAVPDQRHSGCKHHGCCGIRAPGQLAPCTIQAAPALEQRQMPPPACLPLLPAACLCERVSAAPPLPLLPPCRRAGRPG